MTQITFSIEELKIRISNERKEAQKDVLENLFNNYNLDTKNDFLNEIRNKLDKLK